MPRETDSSAKLLTLPLDDTRDRPVSARYNGGVDAARSHMQHWLAVWLSGNALASINVVALRQTRLVLGRVTVCGRVNHFGM